MAAGGPFEGDLAAAADGLDLLVRRLRLLSPRAWERYSAAARTTLADVLEITSRVEGPGLLPPEVPDHVLPDVLAVIGGDLVDAIRISQDVASATELSAAVRRGLDATR